MPHVEQTEHEDQGDLTLPVLTMDQFAATLDGREAEPTQAMIEAGWGVLRDEKVEELPVELMVALWRAMDGAR